MNRTHLFAAAVVLGLSALATPLVAGAQTSKVPDAISIDPGGVSPVRPVPEPAAIAMFAAGLGVTAFALRRAIRR